MNEPKIGWKPKYAVLDTLPDMVAALKADPFSLSQVFTCPVGDAPCISHWTRTEWLHERRMIDQGAFHF